jgi:cell fate regulator YaaT (PSP1 superfamily)
MMEQPIRDSVGEPRYEMEGTTVQVRFKGHRIELYHLPASVELDGRSAVIVEAERGVDLGHLVRTDAGRLSTHPSRGTRVVLRTATDEELRHFERLRRDDEEALRVCRERVDSFGLPMRTVDAEFQFDGNRVTFFFVADGRIDFRALVRDLARIFRTRIELRQIHHREACRRQGGIGPCGRTLCCSSFLQGFEPVTLKMAKRQNLALTPVRISGMCGRLLCCLTYDPEGGGGCDGCRIPEDEE